MYIVTTVYVFDNGSRDGIVTQKFETYDEAKWYIHWFYTITIKDALDVVKELCVYDDEKQAKIAYSDGYAKLYLSELEKPLDGFYYKNWKTRYEGEC